MHFRLWWTRVYYPQMRFSPRRESCRCMYISWSPPSFHLLTCAVSFLALATGYPCYSDSADRRCGSYSTSTIARPSATNTPTLAFANLCPTGTSNSGAGGGADSRFIDGLRDDSGSDSDFDSDDSNGLNSNGSNSNMCVVDSLSWRSHSRPFTPAVHVL